jgi:hypothetical protein
MKPELTYKQHREQETKKWPKPNCKVQQNCMAYLTNKSYYQCQRCKHNIDLTPLISGLPVDD